MKTIKIFVASSEELVEERREISDMVAHLNYALNKLDINILLVKWNFLTPLWAKAQAGRV